MRRIYESRALDRADDSPFQPNESDARADPRAARTVPAAALSRALVPRWLRNRAITLAISTPQPVYAADTAVPFTVTMKNALPFPVTIPTRSPLLWTWYVDGLPQASHVPAEPPDEPGALQFGRGEWKTFDRRWSGTFRTATAEWAPAPPGEYTIGASINVDDPVAAGLQDQTTIRLE